MRAARSSVALLSVAIALGGALGAIGQPCPAGAQPRVQVRAETRIELRSRRDGERQLVEGVLRDDLGAPLADREVRVTVHEGAPDGARRDARTVRTDRDGSFSVELGLPLGAWWVHAEFAGDEHHRASPPAARELVLDRAHVTLEVEIVGGMVLDLDRPEHHVRVTASSEARGAALPVTIEENGQELARGITGEDGTLDVVLHTADLGTTPSATRLVVRTDGDTSRTDARTEVPVVRFRRTSLRLDVDRSRATLGEHVRLSGTLDTAAGPVSRKAVGLWAGDLHLATVLTDDAGRFAVDLPTDDLGVFDGSVIARFESDAPWWGASESPPIALRVEPPGATPWPWILASVAVSALIFGLAGRRRRAQVPGPADLTVTPPVFELASRDRLLPDSVAIAGRVVDVRRDRPIVDAAIRVTRPDGTIVEHGCDREGRFAIELGPGAHGLEIVAPGFEIARHRVTLPHRGEWSTIVVRLRSLRELAWAPLDTIAARLLPSSDPWGTWTARDLEDAARQRPPVPSALPSLVAAVERAAYAEEPPRVEDLESIRVAAREIESEIDARGASSDTLRR